MATPQLPRYIGRLLIAALFSFALNVALLAVAAGIDPQSVELSRVQRWSWLLLSPAYTLTFTFVPGHSGKQIVAIALFSLTFYFALAWVAISVPVWWRRRL